MFNPIPTHWLELDEHLCVRLNRTARYQPVRQGFQLISRLGNGVFWYALMGALLAIQGAAAVRAVAHMVIVGLVCTVIYKCLKAKTSRPRPYQVSQAVTCNAKPLDPFSFPSGHTLHAVAFTTVALAYYPRLSWLLIPFTFLIALSRMILGLHYPSDVLAGMVIGVTVCRPVPLPLSPRAPKPASRFREATLAVDVLRLYCDNDERTSPRRTDRATRGTGAAEPSVAVATFTKNHILLAGIS